MSFDQIVCTGVLHHLADPDAGLAALRSVLKPDGAMHLMVYAPYGRAGIYMLQEFCRRIGIRATDEGIDDLITVLRALPPGHPMETVMREAPDFQQEAALADALLHPQDRAYSVPQLFDFLEAGQLTFGRWVKQAPYSPYCGVMARLPQASRIAELPQLSSSRPRNSFAGPWFAIAPSPIATMVLHPLGRPGLSTLGEMRGYGTCLFACQKPSVFKTGWPLPVLINQNHTYRDLDHARRCGREADARCHRRETDA